MKELIKMCDCPEIQEHYQDFTTPCQREKDGLREDCDICETPCIKVKRGDWYWRLGSEPENFLSACITGGEIRMLDKHSDKRLSMVTCVRDYFPTELHVFIPRIEDVLEWLSAGLRTDTRSMEAVIDYIQRKGWKSILWDTSLIKVIIIYYMEKTHHKDWDGEKWQ